LGRRPPRTPMRANNALLRRSIVAREVHEGSPPPPEELHPICLCCKVFRGGAGDGNRTRTFSLGMVTMPA
jgi:hypothetical protein